MQFNENHEWIGRLGIIEKIEAVGGYIRYLIGVPIPNKGTSYIFSLKSKHEIEYIGVSVLVPKGEQ